MSSLDHVPEELVRREAAVLHDLLAGSLWDLDLRPVALGEEESPLIRAFWGGVGWDDRLARHIGPPELEASRRLAQEQLEDYRQWGSPLEESALPALYRVVMPDTDGVGFAVTDESSGALDPPVIGLSADEGTRERIGESYLRQAAYLLIHAATRPWHQSDLETEPPLERIATDRPFAHLAPGVRKVTEDVWLLPRTADIPEVTPWGAIRSFDGLWRWLVAAHGLRRLRISTVPGTSIALAASPDVLRAGTQGWREIEGILPALAYRVGTFGAAPAILVLGSPSTLACSAHHQPAVTAALAERGWLAPRS